jgi:hypothetical protein
MCERSGPTDESIFGRPDDTLEDRILRVQDHADFDGCILTRKQANALYEMIGEFIHVTGAHLYEHHTIKSLQEELDRINSVRIPLL